MPSAPRAESNAIGVWTGETALFLSIDHTGVRVQAFDPGDSSWRSYPIGPETPSYGISWAWTGNEVILFGGGPLGAPSGSHATSFDPVDGAWRRLLDAPIPMNLSDAVWTGDEMVVVGSAMDRRNEATTRTSQAEAFDPQTDTWRVLPSPPVSAQTAAIDLAGGRLSAWELYGPDSAEWVPDEERWRSLDMGGFEGGECYADGVTVADVVFTWNCGAPSALFAGSSEWGPIDPPRVSPSGLDYGFGRAIAAGSVAIVEEIETIEGSHGEPYLGSPDAPVHLWVWKPPASAPSSTWTPTRADAENLVGNFLSDWQPGWEPYLLATAETDVIRRCRDGADGLVALTDGAVGNWNTYRATELGADSFEVKAELLRDHEVVETETFTVGPGTADGRPAQLVITDVR